MTSAFTQHTSDSFNTIYEYVKTFPTPLLPPGKAHDPKLTDRIASLYVHPSLESLLHILNLDLPSAHFLVRHMQAAPALEGMYIHGLLHRIEGDYDNCRAWYADVCSTPAFVSFWGESDSHRPDVLGFLSEDEVRDLGGEVSEDAERQADAGSEGGGKGPRVLKGKGGGKVPSQIGARAFVSAVERLKGSSKGKAGFEERKVELERASMAEIEALVEWCVGKFGTGKMADASGVWVQPGEEHREIGERMVTGGEGYRKF